MGIAVSKPALEKNYHEVLGDYRNEKEFLWKHRGGFVHFIHSAIADGLLGSEYSRRRFKLERLSYALDPSRDELLSAATVEDLLQTRLFEDAGGRKRETPQYYWMRLAMTEALDQPNPTRAALMLYEAYSLGDPPRAEKAYGESIFNNQKLLFDDTRPVVEAGTTHVPQHYHEHGWAVIDDVDDEHEAIEIQERIINSAKCSEFVLQERFRSQIQLAKADQIPVCDDVVASSFQVMHFDMGHPFVESEGQLFVTHVGIYLPKTTRHEVTARTRIVEIEGLLRHLGLSADEIAAKLIDYTRGSGDGWEGHNTYRLAAFVRFLDAIDDEPELREQIDKTVGQWFGTDFVGESDAYGLESDFYAKHGIDLNSVEQQVPLKPGQLLLLDNTRVIHGRIGRRRAKELFNYMWGVNDMEPEDIGKLREHICRQVSGGKG